MTLGSNLETLDLLGSSANVLSPGEGEASAGWGKGSVIPNLALLVSERAVTSGSLDPASNLASNSPYDPGPHELALVDGDLSHMRGTLQGS